jgi:hypothetical protein
MMQAGLYRIDFTTPPKVCGCDKTPPRFRAKLRVNTFEVLVRFGAGSSQVLDVPAASKVIVDVISACDCGFADTWNLDMMLLGAGRGSKLFSDVQAQMGPEVLPELSSDDLMPLKLCKRLKCLHIHGKDVLHLDFLHVSPSPAVYACCCL